MLPSTARAATCPGGFPDDCSPNADAAVCQESYPDSGYWTCDVARDAGSGNTALTACTPNSGDDLLVYGTNENGNTFCCAFDDVTLTLVRFYGSPQTDDFNLHCSGISTAFEAPSLVWTHAGNDTIWGSRSETYGDDIDSGDDNDWVYGGEGPDILYGNGAQDTLWGGEDGDTMAGGAGEDTLYGEGGPDVIYGDFFPGEGTCSGTSCNDRIKGGTEADELYGQETNDDLCGGSGDDYLSGGAAGYDSRTGLDYNRLFGDADSNTYDSSLGKDHCGTDTVLEVDGQVCSVPVQELPILVGRNKDSHVVLSDPEVSRLQCSILVRGRGWALLNLSRNGTRANGQPLPDGRFYALESGDWIGFGHHRIQVLSLPPAHLARTEGDTSPPSGSLQPVELSLRFRGDERVIATLESRQTYCVVPIPRRLARLLATLMEAGLEDDQWAMVPVERELQFAPSTNSMHRTRTDLQVWWTHFRGVALELGVASPAEIPDKLFQAEHVRGIRLALPTDWTVYVVG